MLIWDGRIIGAWGRPEENFAGGSSRRLVVALINILADGRARSCVESAGAIPKFVDGGGRGIGFSVRADRETKRRIGTATEDGLTLSERHQKLGVGLPMDRIELAGKLAGVLVGETE